MFRPPICGSFSSQEDEDDIDELLGQDSTPKRSRKTSHCSRSKDSKNPYSTRGLDKFSALLAELEDKKQKIYTQKGSEDISFVRFVYSNSNNWKPIVVKARDRKQGNGNVKEKQMSHMNSFQSEDKHTIEVSTVAQEVQQQQKEESSQRPVKKNIRWSSKLGNLRHPCRYMPVMMVLILLFLVMYGRSFAILCTSLGWYLVPVIKQRSSTLEETKKTKKDYVRRLSEKNMVNDKVASPKVSRSSSPKSVLSRPAENPTGLHAHRKSW